MLPGGLTKLDDNNAAGFAITQFHLPCMSFYDFRCKPKSKSVVSICAARSIAAPQTLCRML